MARYLKRKYPKKKIILGGYRNFTKKLTENINNLEYIDSLVIGNGENATKEIVKNILNNKPINKIYKIYVRPEELLGTPDYQSFRNLDYFRFNIQEIDKYYELRLNLPGGKTDLFIPYKFSLGCFWGKCRYCSSSGYRIPPKTKNVKQIIEDIKELKETCQTNFFIFYNNNFNSDIRLTKSLLRSMIKNKLNIYWTDSFNLLVMDDELIELLAEAGCIRMDLGLTTANKKLQKFYNNILQDNKYLDNLKKIHDQGIWIDINIIANLPFCYSVKEEIGKMEKYIDYIDAVTLNSYRAYPSDLVFNAEKYGLDIVDERIMIDNQIFPMYFIEREFKGNIKERKKIFTQNYLDWKEFFVKNKIMFNTKLFHLLGLLYRVYDYKNKQEIKKLMLLAIGKEIPF
jgi:radical SAM superfamily enzyme YgiQ (UPF0313 family)